MTPHKLNIHPRSAHLGKDLTANCIVTDNADRPHPKRIRGPAGAHKPRDIVLDDMKLAVVPCVQQLAQPAFIAAQFVLASQRVHYPCANAADTDGAGKSAFCIWAQSQHRFRTTPNRGFHLLDGATSLVLPL